MLKIEQKPGLIYKFDDQSENESDIDDEDNFEWYYEISYNQMTSEGEIVSHAERKIRVKPTEMIHILTLIKYSLPAI